MDLNLYQALVKRLKSLPNKATVGVKAMIHEKPSNFPKLSSRQKSEEDSTPVSFSGKGRFKDVKVGTDPESQDPVPIRSYMRAAEQTFQYRLKGVMSDEAKEIQALELSNRALRTKLFKEQKALLGKMKSNNERPPGAPLYIKFKPVVSECKSAEETKRQRIFHRSFIDEQVNFIEHNKETLFNIKASSPRPVSDKLWVRAMRKTATFHKTKSCDAELSDGFIGDLRKTLEFKEIDWMATQKSWKKRPDTSASLNLFEFSELTGELMVNPCYSYCNSCRKGTSPLVLKGKNLRPRIKIRS